MNGDALDKGMPTYNVYAFVSCDTDLCALGAKVYANDAHGCGGRRSSEIGDKSALC